MGNRTVQFEALVGAHADGLYRFAYWLCRDRARAEDLVQDTFLRAWRGLAGLRDAAAAKTWLYTILRREYARGYERYRPEMVDVDPDHIPATAPADVECWHLRRVLHRLDSDYREPLLLQVLGGFSTAEIAQIMNLSAAAVMTRLFRARQQLRHALSDPLPLTRSEHAP